MDKLNNSTKILKDQEKSIKKEYNTLLAVKTGWPIRHIPVIEDEETNKNESECKEEVPNPKRRNRKLKNILLNEVKKEEIKKEEINVLQPIIKVKTEDQPVNTDEFYIKYWEENVIHK